MATAKKSNLSNILHATPSEEIVDLDSLAATTDDGHFVLPVEDQMRLMAKRKFQPECREDKLFPDVWVKGNNKVVPVRDMSKDHMCMTIGLWLRKEFEARESELLGFSQPSQQPIQKVSPYDSLDTWLTHSESVQTTPALNTMLARLRGMEGGMEQLDALLKERAEESLTAAHAVPDYYLFTQPAFF